METKKYSSYEQIELELKILKLKKELSYQKVVWNAQKINEGFTAKKIINEGIGYYKSIFFNSSGMILNIAIPLIINWLKKKRGN
ncbi:MAG: DUF6327 family protein [Flavobacterium sp.]|uniref:DUF6327 family protein n=1 Tax=Flavobacterium sp. TaxID=239 RepID=UPI002637AF90|nr:DUF6327 family protein [Flavobacterium sp.]MDD5149906.1 DUF6327 family protein [Flavobacterium sp.]